MAPELPQFLREVMGPIDQMLHLLSNRRSREGTSNLARA
jgi:hypothetical protein